MNAHSGHYKFIYKYNSAKHHVHYREERFHLNFLMANKKKYVSKINILKHKHCNFIFIWTFVTFAYDGCSKIIETNHIFSFLNYGFK